MAGLCHCAMQDRAPKSAYGTSISYLTLVTLGYRAVSCDSENHLPAHCYGIGLMPPSVGADSSGYASTSVVFCHPPMG